MKRFMAFMIIIEILIISSNVDAGKWRSFTAKDGLISKCAYSIAVDSKGNVWVGTNKGLSKYDRITWKTFTMNNGLADDAVWSIAIDSKDNVWVGTLKGLNKYDGKEWKLFTTEDGLADAIAKSIAIDSKDNVWVATWRGVSKYDGKNWITFTEKDGLLIDIVNSIAIDKMDNVWVGFFGGASKYDGKKWTKVQFAIPDANYPNDKRPLSITSIVADSKNNIWFGARGVGVFSIKGDIEIKEEMEWPVFTTKKDELSSTDITSIAIDNKDNLWIGTVKGLCKYDGKIWEKYTTDDGLVDNSINSIAIDKEGNIWIVSSQGGISYYDQTSWETFTKIDDGIASDDINGIFVDSKDNVWIGGAQGIGGLSKYEGKAWITFATKDILSCGGIRAIDEDSKGNLWIGTWWKGIIKYDGKSWDFVSPNSGWIGAIAIDKKDNVWSGTSTIEELKNKRVLSIAVDNKNNILWFGTEKGLVRYNGIDYATFTINNGSIKRIDSIAIAKNGNIWIGGNQQFSVNP